MQTGLSGTLFMVRRGSPDPADGATEGLLIVRETFGRVTAARTAALRGGARDRPQRRRCPRPAAAATRDAPPSPQPFPRGRGSNFASRNPKSEIPDPKFVHARPPIHLRPSRPGR